MKQLVIKYIDFFCSKAQQFKSKSLVMCCLALSFACEDFVEVDPPQSEISGEIIFTEPGTVNAALSAIYTQVKDNVLLTGSLSGTSYLLGLYADELDYFSGPGTAPQFFYNNSIIPSDGASSAIWNGAYNVIYNSNSIIEGVNNSTTLSEADKNQFKGEALFLRACIHFYMVNLFGDIPYITSTDYQLNTTVSRTPSEEIYSLLISDLAEAKVLLSDAYVSGERIRANKGAAIALLARVYLYMQDWEKAEEESTAVISNSGQYLLENDLNNVFLKESTSAILQLKPTNEDDPSHEGQVFIFVSGPPANVALTNQVINAFEPGDARRTNWVGTVTNGTESWYHAFKYKQQNNLGGGGNSTEYSVVLRLAEQYLIRAEARAQQGDITGAQEDLNVIRTRAGLSNTTATTTNDLLDAILQERQVELFTEFGHRFFDLKRMGEIDAVLSTVKPGWNSTDVLIPLPESELLINPNLLPQNSGY